MFAVALNYLLALGLVLVVFALAWGASRLSASREGRPSSESSRPFVFLVAIAILLVAVIGEVGMVHDWSSAAIAARIDQGVFFVLMSGGMFLLVLDYLGRRSVR